MDLLIGLLVLFVAGAIFICIAYIYYIARDKDLRKQFKHISFLVRWWLIGRYHCKTDEKLMRFYNTLNKIFWGVVLIGICLVIGKIIEGIQWLL